ncbi:MAG: DUF3467 domain-containing protein [Deltaproteobacteria bacterium]|nr:DUF3467 domain-containing protein [Deltaproteobacteria bacterium]MBW2348894.1 DUF3467 domain-containing protein [Deltaproteobacteria bacterium]
MAEKKDTAQNVEAPATTIRWNTANLKSSYANVCNVTSTREEVVLNFGINQSWERGQQEMEIQLTDRIILSPFAAKRLSTMLTRLMGEYEARYGELNLEPAAAPAGTTKQ